METLTEIKDRNTGEGRQKSTRDRLLMPVALTAENGAKGLLAGEFFEEFPITCQFCNGNSEEYCEECGNTGAQTIKIPVSWTTIKRIYAMAVNHLGQHCENCR
jgi:hypothetical protein